MGIRLGILLASQDVGALIRDLSSDDPAVRDRALMALVEAGPTAIPALKEAAKSSDIEVAARSKEAIRRIELAVKLAPIRARLSQRLMERVPGLPEPLALGAEPELLEWVRKLRGVVPATDLEEAGFVAPEFQIRASLLAPVFEVMWERMASARAAGTPMNRLESIYVSALENRGEADGSWIGYAIHAVPPKRIFLARFGGERA